MRRYSKFLQSIIPEKQQKCEARYCVSCIKVSSCENNTQARQRSSKAFNFVTRSSPATTSPSQLLCSIPDIIYVLSFDFFIFLSHSVFCNCEITQMFNCQITFSKVFLWYKVLLNSFKFKIEAKKLYSPWCPNVFTVLR